jgi:membrane dipeptidase
MTKNAFDAQVCAHFACEQAARKLHSQTTVVLGYCNIPLTITEDGLDPGPILGDSSLCATNLERLLLGGVKVIVWSPGIPFWKPSGESLTGRDKVRFLQQQLRTVHELPKLTEGLLQVARNAREIRQINESGGTAILLHLSGVSHLNDLGILREYYDLGVRMIHCGFQDWTGECSPGDPDFVTRVWDWIYHAGKLNEHGVRTIEEMKRLGIIVDMAHIRPEGFDDIVPRLEGTPFVYSHGGCHSLVPHWRNLTDSQIARIAEHHGVCGIGVYTHPTDIGTLVELDEQNKGKHARIAEGRQRRTEEIAASSATVRDYIRRRFSQTHWQNWEERALARLKGFPFKGHIQEVVAHMKYLRDHSGPEVVGYGPDYEHTYGYLIGLEEADKTPNLTRELLAAGFSESETQAAMGHNFMRVFDAVLK